MSRFQLWNSIRRDFQILKEASPGRRFRDFGRRKSKEGRHRTWLSKLRSIGFGIFLVVVGLTIGWLPGPGGFLAILGCAVLIPFIPGMAAVMDHAEVSIRKLIKAIRQSGQT